MFGLSPIHLAILLVVGLFVFGPERVPTLIRDLGKALRQVRSTAQSMQDDLKAELGPEVGDLDLRSLHPRTFVEKHLFGDEEDPLGLDFLTKTLNDPEPSTSSSNTTGPGTGTGGVEAHPGVSFDKPIESPTEFSASYQTAPGGAGAVKYDEDAT